MNLLYLVTITFMYNILLLSAETSIGCSEWTCPDLSDIDIEMIQYFNKHRFGSTTPDRQIVSMPAIFPFDGDMIKMSDEITKQWNDSLNLMNDHGECLCWEDYCLKEFYN